MNCERLLLHTLKLAHLNAISTGRAVANSIAAKNPWSHAFSWGKGGQLRAQENQWVSLEDANDVETPFWFVKGEDINYAAQIIFGNMLADKKDHGCAKMK